MATASRKSVKVEMVVDRDTKNTRRYNAVSDDAPISTIYVNKSAFPAMPDSVTVTVAVKSS